MGGRCKRVVASGSGVSPSTPSHLKIFLRWFAGEATKGRAEQLGGIMKVVDYINMPGIKYSVVLSNGRLIKVRVK